MSKNSVKIGRNRLVSGPTSDNRQQDSQGDKDHVLQMIKGSRLEEQPITVLNLTNFLKTRLKQSVMPKKILLKKTCQMLI